MATLATDALTDRQFYEQAAREFYLSLPLEHFMESTPKQIQRKIAIASFDQIHNSRADIWCYNVLLIQYPTLTIRSIGRAVPDNTIILHHTPIIGTGSYNLPFEEARLFMALEYVSESSKRKDFIDNLAKYAVSAFAV